MVVCGRDRRRSVTTRCGDHGGTQMEQQLITMCRSPVSGPALSSIEGTVQPGQQLARRLGFPTANVALPPDASPTFGVYAAWTHLCDGRIVPGVASVGVRPTVGGVEPLLEVWLFEFDEDLYGSKIRTDLVKFLRGEVKFDTLEIMTEQVMLDAQEARIILSTQTLN